MTRRVVLVAVLVAACLLFVVFWGRADTPTPAPHPSCPPGTVRLLIAHDRVATAGMHDGLVGDRKGLLVELSRLPALPSLRGCGK